MPYARRLSEEEIAEKVESVPAWRREGDAIVRELRLADFAASMRLVNAVADVAVAADHHPDIDIRWNRVVLALSSHASGGLTAKDFELAKQIDGVVSGDAA